MHNLLHDNSVIDGLDCTSINPAADLAIEKASEQWG